MSIRTINFNVEADRITPSTLQRGGLQGEHNATELIFYIQNSLAEKLEAAAAHIPFEDVGIKGELYYRFEGHTCMGLKDSTLPVRFEISDGAIKEFSLNYQLENWLTRDGGNITVYLIFSILANNETYTDIFSYPAKLKLESVPDGEYTDGKNYESVAKLSVAAENAAERAESAAEISEAAKEQTVDARFALENSAEFIFLGGDASGAAEVDLVVDGELSEYSLNPISNEAVAKELKKYTPTEKADEKYVDAEDYALDKKNEDEERSNIKEKLADITDYIVETKTVGIWTYEKRASGICRCWGLSDPITENYIANGTGFVSDVHQVELPSNLFKTITSYQAHPLYPHTYLDTCLIRGENKYFEISSARFSTQTDVTLQYSMEVIGTWK